jgi:hypothetical protein
VTTPNRSATAFLCATLLIAAGASSAATFDDDCRKIKTAELTKAARAAPLTTQLRRHVLPGGVIAKAHIPLEAPKDQVFCARFVDGDQHLRVVSVTPGEKKEGSTSDTVISLEVPAPSFGWKRERQLIVVSLKTAGEKLDLAAPGIAVMQKVEVSSRPFSIAGGWAAAILAYVFAACTLGKRRSGFGPVYLTADSYGKASLGQLQIFGFTLVVLGLLVYVLLRSSELSDLSSDILLLLGVSAVGSAGSKVAQSMTRRLSYENWAWLRNQGWLVAPEKGTDKETKPEHARWADLLRSNGGFDVYSFQLATVSVVVALALMWSDLDALATFTIPANILALLGLSNVVYIGGRAVAPDSVGELDKKVTALRQQEIDWLAKVAVPVAAAADQAAKIQAAKGAAPEKYDAYVLSAREAARMLKSFYGAGGTKFNSEPIRDDELLPSFP